MKIVGCLAVATLSVLTVYYTVEAFTPETSSAPVQEASRHSIVVNDETNLKTIGDAKKTVIIDRWACVADISGITTVKQEATCTVSVDRQAYPFVGLMVGSCNDLDATSPENNAGKLVIVFKGEAPLLLTLWSQNPEVSLGSTDAEPSVAIMGIAMINGGYEKTDCNTLPADPN